MSRPSLAPPGFGRQRWIMPAVLLLAGLPFLLGGLAMAVGEWRFRAHADRVVGTIVEAGGSTYRLIVAYVATNGSDHQIESAGSDLHRDKVVGMPVGVYHDRHYPARARLDLFVDAWLIATFLSVFGAFFALPGALFGWTAAAPLRLRWRLRRRGRNYPTHSVEVIPVLRDFFDPARGHRGDRKLRLWQEEGQWKLRVDGEMFDPFAPHAARDHDLQYRIEAEWLHPESGLRYRALSALLDAYPGNRLQGRVEVRALPDRPQVAEARLTPLAGTPMSRGRRP